MVSYEVGELQSPQERLTVAKDAFRYSLLQNDTLFSILQARLSEPSGTDADLPDFGLEPTLRRNDDGTSSIGLRINRSATTEGGLVKAYIGVYDYLPLGRMDRATGVTTVAPELEAALTTVGKDIADALGVLQAWQTGVGEMSSHFPEPFMLDPATGTFELPEELMARNYLIEPGQ